MQSSSWIHCSSTRYCKLNQLVSICVFVGVCGAVQLKERQKEDHMFDNEEKFVTSAYRKKLEEDKIWLESQKLK